MKKFLSLILAPVFILGVMGCVNDGASLKTDDKMQFVWLHEDGQVALHINASTMVVKCDGISTAFETEFVYIDGDRIQDRKVAGDMTLFSYHDRFKSAVFHAVYDGMANPLTLKISDIEWLSESRSRTDVFPIEGIYYKVGGDGSEKPFDLTNITKNFGIKVAGSAQGITDSGIEVNNADGKIGIPKPYIKGSNIPFGFWITFPDELTDEKNIAVTIKLLSNENTEENQVNFICAIDDNFSAPCTSAAGDTLPYGPTVVGNDVTLTYSLEEFMGDRGIGFQINTFNIPAGSTIKFQIQITKISYTK
jgi:hypothetical protein